NAFHDALDKPAGSIVLKGKKPKDEGETDTWHEPEKRGAEEMLRDRVRAVEGAINKMCSMIAMLLKVNRELVEVQRQAAMLSPAWPSTGPTFSGAPLFRTPDIKIQVSTSAQD
ncbi:hypothetical protein GGI05_007245, partial [Coemansia sp. RSA 2603]